MLQQLAINSNTYSGFSLEEALEGASSAGFKKVELAAVEHTPHVLPTMTAAERMEVKNLLHRYGMQCVGLGAHSNLMTEAGIANLMKSIDLASFINCNYIITSTGEAHGDKDVIEEQAVLIEKLQPVVEKCEEKGITLAIETHGNNFATGRSLNELAASMNHCIKINYDTANVIFYGHTEPYADLEFCLDQVAFIHLKDKLGETKEWNFPAIGDGNIDFKKIFEILRKGNYSGPISVEIEFTPEGPASVKEVDGAVRRSMDYLRKILD